MKRKRHTCETKQPLSQQNREAFGKGKASERKEEKGNALLVQFRRLCPINAHSLRRNDSCRVEDYDGNLSNHQEEL